MKRGPAVLLVALTGLAGSSIYLLRENMASTRVESAPGHGRALASESEPPASQARGRAFAAAEPQKTKLSDAPRVQAALNAARAHFEKIEVSNVNTLQQLAGPDGSETRVVSVSAPTESQYQQYVNSLTSVLDGFKGSPAEKETLRENMTNLLAEFAEYPMPRKILHLSVSADGKQASFTERFINEDSAAMIDEKTSSFESVANDRLRDDDWFARNSWARTRYGYLLKVDPPAK